MNDLPKSENVEQTVLYLNEIREDPRNPNVMPPDRYESAKRHIEKTGRCAPLVVRELNENSVYYNKKGPEKQYMLLDGQHRRRILMELGYKEWDVHVWKDVTDVNAGLYLMTLNRNTGEDDLIKRAELVVKINEIIPLEDIAQVVPVTVNNLQNLIDFRQDIQAVDLGLIQKLKDDTEKDVVHPLKFVLYPKQYETVAAALLHIKEQEEGNNKPALALLKMAEHYLSTLPPEQVQSLKAVIQDQMQAKLPVDEGNPDDAFRDDEETGFEDDV